MGSSLLRLIWMVRRTSIVRLVSDTPLDSVVKDTDGPIVWSDGSRNKYDPVDLTTLNFLFITKKQTNKNKQTNKQTKTVPTQLKYAP